MKHVLLVDDDRALRDSLKRVLRHEPYKLTAVDSAESALAALSACDFEVIVSDQKMPGVLGVDLLHHVKEIKPDVVRIMLSGEFTIENAVDAVNKCKVFRLLPKPCDTASLALTIREALLYRDTLKKSLLLLRLLKRQRSVSTGTGDSSLNDESSNADETLVEIIERATEEALITERFLVQVRQ